MRNFSFFIVFLLIHSILFSQNVEEKESTASKNVTILEKEFVIPNLNNISHKIWVYLPPNYEVSTKKFPVIYMHDAQNLFDDKTSYIGEWKVVYDLANKDSAGNAIIGEKKDLALILESKDNLVHLILYKEKA